MSQKPSYQVMEKRIQELEQTEEELAQIFSMSLDMICIADIGTATFIKVNPAFSEILGFSEQELLEKPFLDFIHPDDIDSTLNVIDQKLQSGAKVINFENRYRCKDGSYRWLSWVSHPDSEKGVTYALARDITDWKQNEEALKKSKALLDATGRMARVGGWELDADTLAVTWTDETYRIHEVPLDYKPPLQEAIKFFAPEDRPKLEQAIQLALDHGEPYDLELRFITANGKHLWSRTKCEAEVIDRKVIKLKGTFQDITERKRAELALQASERELKQILEATTDGIWTWNFKSNELTFSPKYYTMLGYEPNEFPANYENWLSLIHPDDRQKALAVAEKYLQSKPDAYENEFRLKTSTGDYRWILARARVAERDNNGDAVFMIGNHQDITERRQAEEALSRSEKKYREIIENANSIILRMDSDGKIVFFNKFAQVFFEFSEEEILGRNAIGTIVPRTESSGRDLSDMFSDITKNPGKYIQNENENMKKNGERVWVSWTNKAIRSEDGRVSEILSIGNDITEKKLLEAKLRQAHKMESIGTLAGGIAHDFNNILSSIIGFTELALDETQKGTALEDSLHEVYAAGKRAKELVSQILAFARQSGEKRSPIKPGSVAKEVLKFIRSTIPTSIEIKQNIESESWISGNATQLHQVLLNLCTNAAQAMEESGGVLDLSIKDVACSNENLAIGMKKGDYVEIKVTDTGPGVSAEIIDSLFEPYFTTKRPGEGTGMGLAMVQGVVESYGGKITVGSELGKGTTFAVYLPITKKRSVQDANVAEKIPTGTERILLVDDEAPIAKMGSQILERLGYSVTTRTSSIEALERFRSKPNDFDLVVTDMTMPNLTGDRLAVELMKIRPDIPVILCTGYSKKISDETASEIGIKAFAYKPVVKVNLAKTVRKVLDEAKGYGCHSDPSWCPSING